MDANSIYLLATTLSVIIMAYLAIREARSKRDNNVTAAVKNLADALNLSSAELAEELKESALLRGTVEELQKQINDLIKHRNEREERISASEKQIVHLTEEAESLRKQMDTRDREYAQQIATLRDENASIRAEYRKVVQILKDNRIEGYQPRDDLLDTGKFKGSDNK